MNIQGFDVAGEPEAHEIRVCPSCHRLNSRDQAGQTAPVNSPAALLQLLERLAPAPEEASLLPRRLGTR